MEQNKKLTTKEIALLEKIKFHFEEIEHYYNHFSLETQEKILLFHNEEGSLPHCIRWGLQAAEELIENNK